MLTLERMLLTTSMNSIRHECSIPSHESSSAIANQESLSGLETEMRKLEGIVKEVADEMDYLKLREERFSQTNGKFCILLYFLPILTPFK
jgi:hypothetical protein